MLARVLATAINGIFWLIVAIFATGGYDLQTSVGGQPVRIDATRTDLFVLLFLLLLALWRMLGRSHTELRCVHLLQTGFERIETRLLRAAAIGLAIATVLYVAIPLLEHRSFQTGVDLAIFSQAYWNTLQGDFLFSSIQGGIALWGEHFNPAVLGILPVFWIWPRSETLLVLQSLALVGGAIPLFLLARRELQHAGLAVVLTFAYLLYLPLRLTNLFDFHPIAFATPLILFAYYFLRRDEYGRFALVCVLIAATKETGPIAAGLLGLACVLHARRRWLGVTIVAGSLLWFLIALLVVMPAFNPKGVGDQMARYDYLGSSAGEILDTLLTRPLYVLSQNVSSRELFYPVRIFAPVAFLPLLTPFGLLTLPYLAINLLEITGMQVRLVHYQAELAAFVFIAAVFGAKRLLENWPAPRLAAAIAAGSFLFLGQSDIYRVRETWPREATRPTHELLAGLPADGKVSAQAAIAPHLTQRTWLFIFPEVEKADWVVVDYELDPWPVRPDRFRRTVRRLRRSGFELAVDTGRTRIYRRSGHASERSNMQGGPVALPTSQNGSAAGASYQAARP